MSQIPAARHLTYDDPRFPHGTTRGGHAGCPCLPCRGAKAEHKRLRQIEARNGNPVRQDATAAREHLEALLQAVPPALPATLASATGVNPATIRKILNGKTLAEESVRRAILATTPAMLARHCPWASPAKAIQVIHSLEAQGWSGGWISTQLGLDGRGAPSFIHRPGRERIRRELHQQLLDLAERVGDDTGPATRVATIAAKHGYLPLRFYDADGQLLPPEEVATAELLENPDAERTAYEWSALRRLCALRAILIEGLAPTSAIELHGGRHSAFRKHWGRLHVHLRASRPCKDDPARPFLDFPADKQRFVEIIRRHVAAIPVGEVALLLADPNLTDPLPWTAADVSLDYDPVAAQQAMYDDLAAECGHQCDVCLHRHPAAPAPAATPERVALVRRLPHENRTPWRTEPAVIRTA